jgi:hypothetical protein
MIAVNPNSYLGVSPSASFIPTAPAIPDPWRFWIAENKMLGNPDEQILQVLTAHGLDYYACKRELAIVAAHPYIRAGRNFAQALAKMTSYDKIRGQLAEQSPQWGKIERRATIDGAEFFEKYYVTNTPVIFTGMMDRWTALQKWSLEYLSHTYGGVQVQVQFDRHTNPLYELEYEKHTRSMVMADYIQLVQTGGPTNNYYMVANNSNLDLPEFRPLLADMYFPPDIFLPEPPKGSVYFWLGPAGTITPLHHDPCNLMMAQISGRKLWRIIPPWYARCLYNYRGVFSCVDLTAPDYDRYPLFREIQIIDEVLHPGEIIFMPVGWWHFVQALDISISVSMTHFCFHNSYEWQYPDIQR